MKKIAALLLTMSLAIGLAGCGSKPAAPANNEQKAAGTPAPGAKNHLEEIKAAGKIVLGTSADYPPYEFHKIDGGKDEIVGWEIDLATEIAKELGVKLEIKDTPFDGLIANLKTGKVDFVISAMTITDERKQSVDFSEPYFQNGQAILTTKEKAATITGPADLKGKKVGVQLGTTGEAEAKKIEGAQLKTVDKFETLILDLLAGKVDAVVGELAVGKNFERKNPKLTVVGEPLVSEHNGVALRKGDAELLDAINAALKKIKAEGKIEAFTQKWETAQ